MPTTTSVQKISDIRRLLTAVLEGKSTTSKKPVNFNKKQDKLSKALKKSGFSDIFANYNGVSATSKNDIEVDFHIDIHQTRDVIVGYARLSDWERARDVSLGMICELDSKELTGQLKKLNDELTVEHLMRLNSEQEINLPPS